MCEAAVRSLPGKQVSPPRFADGLGNLQEERQNNFAHASISNNPSVAF